MKSFFFKPLVASLFVLFISAGFTVSAQNYALFGDASIAAGNGSPRGVEVTTSGTTGYGGIDLSTDVKGKKTISQLNFLATDYKITQGPIGLGSPRFVVETNAGNLFIYVGTAPNYNDPANNIWTNTGNLVTPSSIVDASQLGGSFYETYADVQAAYGNLKITAVYIVMDGPSQTVVFDNTMVNNAVVTYENKQGKYN